MRLLKILSLTALLMQFLLAQPGISIAEETPPLPTPEPEQSMSEYLKEYYRRSTEGTPTEVYDWVRKDVQNIYGWEYQSKTVPTNNDKALTKALNEFGKERWEVVSVIPKKDGKATFVMKRRRKSYLRHLPVKDVMRILSSFGDSEPEGPSE